MENKSKYWKEIRLAWRDEIKSWIGWGNLRQGLTASIIAVGGLIILVLTGKTDVIVGELWIRLATYMAWGLWLLFIIITSFITANKKLFEINQKEIDVLESTKNRRISLYAYLDKDEERHDSTFKQIAIINQSSSNLFSCFTRIVKFSELMSNGVKVNIFVKSNQIPWADSSSRTQDNKVDLLIGIPERIYITKTDLRRMFSYLIGGFNNLVQRMRS